MKKIFTSLAALCLSLAAGHAQQVTTFEARYFSNDRKADGVTDLHGETEIFDNDQRVAFLRSYAGFASRFWGDPGLDTPLFGDADVEERLGRIKPQPLTAVRRTVPLETWRAYGYKKGKEAAQKERWDRWTASGARIEGGCLVLDGASASPAIAPVDWRFRMRASLSEVPDGLRVSLGFGSGKRIRSGASFPLTAYGTRRCGNRSLFVPR